MNILVIGSGIFGISIALELDSDHKVTIIESNDDIMNGASKCNHNRLHFGFHYPRSIETAKQSLDGYELFHKKYKNYILENFPNYYFIHKNSKVNSLDYKIFCDKLNLDYSNETPTDLNMDDLSSSFLTNEPIFDYDLIKKQIREDLEKSNVKLILNKKVKSRKDISGYDVVINTTYSNINVINKLFNIKPMKLKIQDVIIPIFKLNKDPFAYTIMDGNYCSIMPRGFDKNKFLLYHVKESVVRETVGFYTPLYWNIIKSIENIVIFKSFKKIITNRLINKIYKKSNYYFPFLNECEKIDYYRTFRALPINDDDSRLSDVTVSEVDGVKVITVLSGKITTCIETAKIIKNLI
jgi:hypothetical protein